MVDLSQLYLASNNFILIIRVVACRLVGRQVINKNNDHYQLDPK